MADLVLRPAVVEDAHQVASVHRLSRADYYGVEPDRDDDREAMWAHFIVQPDRVTHVVEARGSTAGFLSAHRMPDDTAPKLKLTALYVLPTMYNQGIGSMLHDLYVRQRERGTSGILEVWAGNGRAIDFYARRGWVATQVARPGPQGIDFVTYRLPATGTPWGLRPR